MAHPQTNFSSNFQGVDPPLEGYWHDGPVPCGSGNVVTDIWPNPAGVPVVVKGINALTAEDIVDKLDKTGDASNTTSTFAKATGDTSSMTSGGNLSALFAAISSFFASLKALAFKDKASYNDLSSGVQSSLDKADTALQSHQSVTDNNPTLAWGTTSKVGKVGSTDLRVTMPANPAQNLPASVITSGTFGTDRIADDAITAEKVKDNETLPVNVSGSAARLQWGGGTYDANSVGYTKLVTINVSDANTAYAGIIASVSWRDSANALRTGEGLLVASFKEYSDDTIKSKVLILGNRGGGGSPPPEVMSFSLIKISENIYELWGYVGTSWTGIFATILSIAGTASYPARSFQNTAPAGYSAIPYLFNVFGSGGSATTPVYVDSNGQVKPCDVLSGSTSNFNKRFTWTYTVNQNDQYITTAVINDNINYIAEYVEWHNANVGKLTHPPLIILSVSARTGVANAGLISLCMYRNGEGCDVIGEDYTYMGNVHGSSARNTQYFTDRPFYNGEPYYLCIRNETSNPMWTAGTILDISIRIVAHAVSVT